MNDLFSETNQHQPTGEGAFKHLDTMVTLSEQLSPEMGIQPYHQGLQQILNDGQQILAQADIQEPILQSYTWIIIAEAQINWMLSSESQTESWPRLQQGFHACDQAINTAIAKQSSGFACTMIARALTIEIYAWGASPEDWHSDLEQTLSRHAALMDEWLETLDIDRHIGLDQLELGLMLAVCSSVVEDETDRRKLLAEASNQLQLAVAWFELAFDFENAKQAEECLREVRTSLETEGLPAPFGDETDVEPPSVAPSAPSPSEQAAPLCPHCSKPAKVGAKFCRYCGGSLIAVQGDAPPPVSEPAQLTCPKCGKATKPGKNFCRYCGSPL